MITEEDHSPPAFFLLRVQSFETAQLQVPLYLRPKLSGVFRRATEGTLLEPVRTGSEFRSFGDTFDSYTWSFSSPIPKSPLCDLRDLCAMLSPNRGGRSIDNDDDARWLA
jgi:hypothetical protein